MKINYADKAIIELIVGNAHALERDIKIVRRVASKITNFRKLARSTRHEILRCALRYHHSNRRLYLGVMSGQL